MFSFLLFSVSVGALGSPPKLANPTAVFRPTDYPAKENRQEAAVLLVLEISIAPNGEPLGCEVVVSSGAAKDDTRLCEIARNRGRFVEAHDDEGLPIAGTYLLFQSPSARPTWSPLGADTTLTVTSLPDGKDRAQVSITQIIASSGDVERCTVSSPSGIASIDEQACELIPSHLQKEPIKDHTGKTFRSLRSTRAAFEVK